MPPCIPSCLFPSQSSHLSTSRVPACCLQHFCSVKSLPCSPYYGLEDWTGEHISLRCPFFSLMWTLSVPPTVLASAGAKEWETCLCVLSKQPFPPSSSSAQTCLISTDMPHALVWGLSSAWPAQVQRDMPWQTCYHFLGSSWPPAAAGAPGLHAWRMGEARLACWLVACLWALLLPGFQHRWQEKFPLEVFSLKRFTICFSNLFWLA